MTQLKTYNHLYPGNYERAVDSIQHQVRELNDARSFDYLFSINVVASNRPMITVHLNCPCPAVHRHCPVQFLKSADRAHQAVPGS